jgi:hypothetical protein
MELQPAISQTQSEKEIIEVGILSDIGVAKKESQPKLTQVITGETERIYKSFTKHQNNNPDTPSVKGVQKTSVLGTHIG